VHLDFPQATAFVANLLDPAQLLGLRRKSLRVLVEILEKLILTHLAHAQLRSVLVGSHP